VEGTAIHRYGNAMRFSSFALALPLCLVSCGDKSAVSLTAQVDQANVTVTTAPLGSTTTGGFELKLELGSEASGPTTVTLGNFTLQTAAGSPLIDPLPVDPGSTTFPVVVNKGSSQTIMFTFSSSKGDHGAICAGQVMIVGSVMDSLKGGTDPLSSVPFTPSCS
jgi:hypothetical protein